MTAPGNRQDQVPSLARHQDAFIQTALADDSARVILLRAEPGLGKSTALVELAARLVGERHDARVLILVPAVVLRDQFISRLRQSGTEAIGVDRFRLREMLDAEDGSIRWPRGTAAVSTIAFAHQPGVRDAFAATSWDLIIIDEAHRFGGNLASLGAALVANTERMVLASASLEEVPAWVPPEGAVTIRWDRAQILAELGATDPGVRVQRVDYEMDESEVAVARSVRDLRNALAHGARSTLTAEILTGALQSSPAALESTVRNLLERRRQLADEDDQSGSEGDLEQDQSDIAVRPIPTGPALAQLNELTEKLEAAVNDSKLRAFRGLLLNLETDSPPSRRICVVTSRAATVFYLSAEMEGLGLMHYVVHGAMSSQERESAISEFEQRGGVLITTTVLQSHEALRLVTDLVLYDIPSRPPAVSDLLGRFTVLGRANPLNIHVLVPQSSQLAELGLPIESLRVVLAAPTPETGSQ